MASVDYICEKVAAAVECLCVGTGSFEERLFNAYVSGLERLNSNDPSAEIAEELNWILLMCRRYIAPEGGKMKTVDEMDRFKICQKLVGLLITSSRMTAGS